MGKREYKDTVFVHLFSQCNGAFQNFASLFRALCALLHVDFEPTAIEDFEVMTLDSSLYSGLRTDVVYHVKNKLLVFVEHQSTYNPNMPLRFLEYAVEVLKKLSYKITKYGSKPLSISNLCFIVLYNGKKKMKDVEVSCLSDLMKNKFEADVGLEVKVTTFNINVGHNEELLNRCPVLKEYVLFVDEAERQLAFDKRKGFDIAVDACIRRGILKDYLQENRRIVMGMFFSQFDMDTELQVVREESYDEGWTTGIERGREEGITEGIEKGIERGRAEGREEGERKGRINTARNFLNMGIPIEDVMMGTGLTREEIEELT